MSTLRFAPLIRVSTESQKQQGESLKVQKQQIEHAVQILGGTIPKACWRYSGQEHATKDFEREKFDRLLADAGKGIFDAIICCDTTRWSRDNRRSKEGLEILRNNGIRFFVGASERNLHDPDDLFYLGISVETGEHQAGTQAKKSMESKINRAKEGKPSAGKLPWGRTFDKKTKAWGIDPEKHKIIKQAAKEYLAGKKGPEIAKTYGMNYSNLLLTLRKRCGDKWTIKLNSDRLNIHEEITMDIPRLLPEETIKAIRERTAANRTYNHAEIKNVYSLRSLIFCADCGMVLTGQVNRQGYKYYRHRKRENGCGSLPFHSIRANLVEDAVLFNLFAFFGDKAKMEKAAKQAIPNIEEMLELKDRIASHEKELDSIKKKRSNLITVMEDFGIQHGDVKERFGKLVEREDLLKDEIKELSSRIAQFPTEKEISSRIQLIQRMMETFYKGPDHLKEMTEKDKRSFFQSIFGGKDKTGQRFGVYIKRYEREDGKNGWEFLLKGMLIKPGINDKSYPLFKGEKEAIMDVPEGFFDVDWIEENHNKLNSDSKRNAHNSLSVHQRR